MPDELTFPPPELWIPNVRVLSAIGEGLLAVAVGALRTFARDERYTRRLVTHGTSPATPPVGTGVLSVVLVRLFNGRAGEEQFTFIKGEPGKLAYHTAEFQVELSVPWPKPVQPASSPIRPSIAATPDLDDAREQLWSDSFVVYCGLAALALGGIELPWGGQVRSNPVAIGPMQPRDVQTMAAMYCHAHVELPAGG